MFAILVVDRESVSETEAMTTTIYVRGNDPYWFANDNQRHIGTLKR